MKNTPSIPAGTGGTSAALPPKQRYPLYRKWPKQPSVSILNRYEQNIARIRSHGSELLCVSEDPRPELAESACIPMAEGWTWLDSDALRRSNSPRDADQIILRVAQALTQLHEAGFHMICLSPDNLLVHRKDASTHIMLANFISAATADQTESPSGLYLPFPEFAAPEVRRLAAGLSGGAVLPACDVFSMGMLYHLLLCGEMPEFGERTPEGIPAGSMILSKEIDFHRRKIIAAMLRCAPDQRIPSVSDAYAEIYRISNSCDCTIRIRSHSRKGEILSIHSANGYRAWKRIGEDGIVEFHSLLSYEQYRLNFRHRLLYTVRFPETRSGQTLEVDLDILAGSAPSAQEDSSARSNPDEVLRTLTLPAPKNNITTIEFLPGMLLRLTLINGGTFRIHHCDASQFGIAHFVTGR